MSGRDLSRLLRPAHVAVIGGGAWGAGVVGACRAMGFAGPVWPVHPTKAEIGGLPCFARLEDLPEPPDAAFIAINRHAAIEAAGVLSALGAGGAVCFASGFAESADGAGLQAELLRAAGGMPVLGPNCYGMLNYLDGAALWPDQHGGTRIERGVAIVAQSSNILVSITMGRRGLPLAYAIAAGNQAQVSAAEIGAALIGDERVTALGLHLEGIGDRAALEALSAKARALGKPVAVLRVGRTAAARETAVSHTAALTGGDAAAAALLKRLGFAELRTMPAFLETLKLLDVHGALPGRRLLSMSCSGGEAGLVSDLAAGRRLELPAFPDPEAVAATVNPLVRVANPLDYHTFDWGKREPLQRTFAAAMGGGFDLGMLLLDFPRTDRCSEESWEPGVEALVAAAAETGLPATIAATLPEAMPEARVEALRSAGIAALCGLDEALAAIEAAADIGAAMAGPAPLPMVAEALPAGAVRLLDEAEAKGLLAGHGIAVPEGAAAPDAAGAARVAARLGGPVALKVLGLAHKTEAGGVALGLDGETAVLEAASRMPAGAFLVEEMAGPVVAELILGVTHDAAAGPVLTLGSGGVMAELLADTVTLALPVREAEVRAALDGLRIRAVLAGHRGRPAGDVEAVVAAVLAFAGFAVAEAGRLVEAEINPLIVTPGSAVAADALIRLAE